MSPVVKREPLDGFKAESQTGAHPKGPAEKPQNQERQVRLPPWCVKTSTEDNMKQQTSGEEGFVRRIVLGATIRLTWQ
jgi:hypothetical protein